MLVYLRNATASTSAVRRKLFWPPDRKTTNPFQKQNRISSINVAFLTNQYMRYTFHRMEDFFHMTSNISNFNNENCNVYYLTSHTWHKFSYILINIFHSKYLKIAAGQINNPIRWIIDIYSYINMCVEVRRTLSWTECIASHRLASHTII